MSIKKIETKHNDVQIFGTLPSNCDKCRERERDRDRERERDRQTDTEREIERERK